MELVSSKDRVLNAAEIFAVDSYGKDEEAMAAMLAVPATPNFKLIQVDNTLFLTKKTNVKKTRQFAAYMYNAETIQNLTANIIEFMEHLHRNNVFLGVIFYVDDKYTQNFIAALEQTKNDGVKMSILSNPRVEQYGAFIELDKEAFVKRADK